MQRFRSNSVTATLQQLLSDYEAFSQRFLGNSSAIVQRLHSDYAAITQQMAAIAQ
jgi:hypothetical protein